MNSPSHHTLRPNERLVRVCRSFVYCLSLVLLAWLPALAHDLAGDPTNRIVLSIPAVTRVAILLAVTWVGLGLLVSFAATFLTTGKDSSAAAGLGGSALFLATRETALPWVTKAPLAADLKTPLLICIATAAVALALTATASVLPRRFHSVLFLLASIAGLTVTSMHLWSELGFDDPAMTTGFFWVPVVAAVLVLILRSRIGLRSRWVLLFAVLVALSCVVALWHEPAHATATGEQGRARVTSRAPNVVVFMIDTLRADHTGVGGYTLNTTPNLDAVAALRGTVFTQATATASFTKPSVTSFLTSQLADPRTLSPDPNVPTMAEVFLHNGYRTGAFSSNHVLAQGGFERGFQTFLSNSIFRVLRRSFLVGELIAENRTFAVFRLADRLGCYKIPGTELSSAALRWIDSVGDEPFLAYLHSIDPHWPYRKRGNEFLLPDLDNLRNPISLTELLNIQGRDPLRIEQSDPRLRELMSRYDSEVRFADQAFADLLEGLRVRGLERQTLVIVAGDHGEEFFERGGLGHGKDIEEFMIHVPLVFLWPEDTEFVGFPRIVDHPVTLLDVFPTLVDLLHFSQPLESALGYSLRPLLEGVHPYRTGPLVAESLKGSVVAGSIREGDLKVRVLFPDQNRSFEEGKAVVFDLSQDPQEQRPLKPHGQYASLVLGARETLESLWQPRRSDQLSPRDPKQVNPQGHTQDEAISRLRSLGYLN